MVAEKRCPIVDTWWQTETGGHMITPLPGAWLQKPGSASLPFFGVVPVVVNEKGEVPLTPYTPNPCRALSCCHVGNVGFLCGIPR